MRLGVIYEAHNNSHYRAIFPLRALERRGHTVIWPTAAREVPMRELSSCDLVHCYRRINRIGDLRRLSADGVAVSFDNDDNYGATDMGQTASGFAGLQSNKAIFREVLKAARLADVATTPSEALAARYRAGGAGNVRVIENHLERGMFGFGSRSRHRGVVVGWIAGREHAGDLERVPIVDALRRLLDMHRDLGVLTVGLALPLRSERYEHIEEVAFRDLLKITGRMDIGVAPLADTPFNRCRSNVKLKEYASGAAAWLASPVGPYRGLGEQQGGMLVDDDGWVVAIDGLIRSSRSRRRLAGRALRWAKAQTIDRHAEQWEEAFEEAIERSREASYRLGPLASTLRDGHRRK